MAKLKKKINIWVILTAISFIYLAIAPTFSTIFLSLFTGNGFGMFFQTIIRTIFNLSNIVNFVACLAIAICIFTKIDKLAVTLASGLFWLSSVIAFIKSIVILIKYELFFKFLGSIFTDFLSGSVYFLMFIIGIWFTILFFTKKKTPKFAKVVVFLPAVIMALLVCIRFIGNTIDIFKAISQYGNVVYSILENTIHTFNTFVLFIGFLSIAFKFVDFKKKSKNAVEISDQVVIENVTAE